jgi:SPP1 gp7 family putative phage head morphogenesis protein
MAKANRVHFTPSRAAETQFARALRKVAKVSGHIVEAHTDQDRVRNTREMQEALRAYSKLIDPWAKRQAAKMLEAVSKSNRKSYSRKMKFQAEENRTKEIGGLIRLRVSEAPIGQVIGALMNEHVELIKSIPIEAGQRAQELSTKAMYEGTRASAIAEELSRTTEVTESRAMLIARTEVARANASITQARASSIGAQGYIWRTTMDGAERDSHRKMNGKYVDYAREPHLSDGTVGHAGTFPNCRCYQEPVFD